jgi:hypothetical protein
VTEEHRPEIGAAEWKAEVAALARMHGIDCETPGDRGGLGECIQR